MPRVLVVCAFCFVWAASAASQPNWGTWAEEVRKQHPLAGGVYVPGRDGLIDIPPGLQDSWFLFLLGKRGGLLLLGEVHDNPIHHQIRAWLIERSARHWRPRVVFEQIRADQQPALDQFKVLTEAGSGSADELFRLLEWDKSGWPSAQIYKPLFEAALTAKLPIYAGDPAQGRVRSVARGGLSLVPPEERARLRLDDPMPAPLLDALREELVGSHCGMLPAAAMEGMAAAQRYRDAHLADALLSAAKRYDDERPVGRDGFIWNISPHTPAILIAGNGHVRKDRAVPWHLRLRAPHINVTTLLFVEVEEGKTDPKLYLPRDPEGKPAADLLIFTPRAERGDPCEVMRKSRR